MILLLVEINVVFHIDTKDNWTFCGYYSIISKTIFVEQNNLMCGCNKYGCGKSSSISMLPNGYEFQITSTCAFNHKHCTIMQPHIYISWNEFFFWEKQHAPLGLMICI